MAVPTYEQANASLAGVYDPQTSLINQQIGELPGQEQAVQASLDQAKVNAFRDITQGANSRGVLFSGVPIENQGQYIGTKYLPAVAQNKTSFQNARYSLQDKINQINAQRTQQAQGIVSDAQKQAADEAYKAQQLAISSRKASTSSAGSAATKQASMSSAANALKAHLDPLRGRDKFLSPTDYNLAKSAWVQDGYSSSTFDSIFGYYKNPNQPKNQYK